MAVAMAIRGTTCAFALLFLLLLSHHNIPPTTTQQACTQPASACINGLWSSTTCQCDCMPPFCRNANSGECVVAKSSPSTPTSSTICSDDNDDIHNGSGLISHLTRNLADDEGDQDDLSTVTIIFKVNGLPEEVDNDLLEEEMLSMMKKGLIDLSKVEPELKVTNVEKNPSYAKQFATAAEVESGDKSRSVDIYYDVTTVKDPTKDLGEVIISGLRDLYPSISQYIDECTSNIYFHYGVNVNWCINGDGIGDSFELCVGTHPKATVKFGLSNLPLQLNVNELIQQIVEIYEEVLTPVEDLNILTIGMKQVVDRPSSNDTIAKDVYVEVVDQKLVINTTTTADDPALRSIIDQQIQSSEYDILRLIQLYTDNSTELDLNWCIDGNGTYTVCANYPTPMPTEPPKIYPFLLPMWAIITLAAVSVVLTCCLCWCTYSFLEQRDESKNERNMVSYLHTGQQYSKPKKKPIRLPPRSQPLPLRNSRSLSVSRGHQRYYESQPKMQPISLLNDTKYLENLPSVVFQHDNESPPVHAADTLYLDNMNSFVFDDDGQPPPHLPIAANETLYLEDAPSFIFDDDEGQSNNHLAITNGEVPVRSRPKPDP